MIMQYYQTWMLAIVLQEQQSSPLIYADLEKNNSVVSLLYDYVCSHLRQGYILHVEFNHTQIGSYI